MEAATISPPASSVERARERELSSRLRAALIYENQAQLHRLLGGLLRASGFAKGKPVAQLTRVLLDLLHSLRAVALNDEITGLYNRGGFFQTAARLLNVAASDDRPAHLIYLELEDVARLSASPALTDTVVLARRMSHFMRELCPNYGSYDVLGRLGASEFAALTMSADPQLSSRDAILRRARQPQGSCGMSELAVRVGVARFKPGRPITIEELLERARRAMSEPKDGLRSASSLELGSPAEGHEATPDRAVRSVRATRSPRESFATKEGDGVRDDPRAREAAPRSSGAVDFTRANFTDQRGQNHE